MTLTARLFPLLLVLLVSTGLRGVPAVAQAWTLPPGDVYIKLAYGKVTAAEQFTFDGHRVDFIDGLEGDTFRDRSLYLYTEIGLMERLSLVVSMPYKRVFVRDQAFRFRTFAFGTAEVGVRVALLPFFGVAPSRHALAANLTLGLPTGYTRNYAPSADAGQVNVQAMIGYGLSLYPFPGYAQASFGYRLRTAFYGLSGATPCLPGRDVNCIVDVRPDYGNELVYRLEAGLTPLGGALLLQILAGGIWSVQEPVVGFSALNPLPTRQRYLKVGGGVTIYPFRLLGLPSFTAFGVAAQYFASPGGRNAIVSRDLFLGVEYRLTLP